MTLPFRSVIVTDVLLNVAMMWTMPEMTFLAPLARTILGFSTSFGSSERFSFGGSMTAGAAASFLAALGFGATAGAGAASGAGAAGAAGAAVVFGSVSSGITEIGVNSGSGKGSIRILRSWRSWCS